MFCNVCNQQLDKNDFIVRNGIISEICRKCEDKIRKKNWYEANKQRIQAERQKSNKHKEYMKQYHKLHQEQEAEYRKQNREKIAENSKNYYERNREKVKIYYTQNNAKLETKLRKRLWYEQNREIKKQQDKIRYEQNKESIKEKNRINQKLRYEKQRYDRQYILNNKISKNINAIILSKTDTLLYLTYLQIFYLSF